MCHESSRVREATAREPCVANILFTWLTQLSCTVWGTQHNGCSTTQQCLGLLWDTVSIDESGVFIISTWVTEKKNQRIVNNYSSIYITKMHIEILLIEKMVSFFVSNWQSL